MENNVNKIYFQKHNYIVKTSLPAFTGYDKHEYGKSTNPLCLYLFFLMKKRI